MTLSVPPVPLLTAIATTSSRVAIFDGACGLGGIEELSPAALLAGAWLTACILMYLPKHQLGRRCLDENGEVRFICKWIDYQEERRAYTSHTKFHRLPVLVVDERNLAAQRV